MFSNEFSCRHAAIRVRRSGLQVVDLSLLVLDYIPYKLELLLFSIVLFNCALQVLG